MRRANNDNNGFEIGQVHAIPPVSGPMGKVFPRGKTTRIAVMGSNDLVVGDDHLVGASCLRYN